MTQDEATAQAQEITGDSTAVAFYDAHSLLFPYLVAIQTPDGQLGAISSGRDYTEALANTRLWLQMQKNSTQARI